MSEPKLENLKQIELPKFDPTPFIGVKAIVSEVELKSKTFVEKGEEKTSYYIQYRALVDPQGFNGEPLYATRNVGIQVDENGNYGWGENTVMAKFLEKHNIKSPTELKDKTVTIVTQKDSTYLTF